MSFSERLSDLIGPVRGSAARLSEALGVSRSVVNDWLHDKKKPSMENIIAMSEYFSVSTDYLLCITNANKEPAPEISRNGLEMLELFELLSERDQLLTIGRLQGLVEPMIGDLSRLRYHTPPSPVPGDAPQGAAGGRSSGGKAV